VISNKSLDTAAGYATDAPVCCSSTFSSEQKYTNCRIVTLQSLVRQMKDDPSSSSLLHTDCSIVPLDVAVVVDVQQVVVRMLIRLLICMRLN